MIMDIKKPTTMWIERPPRGHLRVFQGMATDGLLTVFVGREPFLKGGRLGWHLSISHGSTRILNPLGGAAPGRLPTWEEIKDARYHFVPDEAYMAMILPPKAEYVNLHPTTMHLHETDSDG